MMSFILIHDNYELKKPTGLQEGAVSTRHNGYSQKT